MIFCTLFVRTGPYYWDDCWKSSGTYNWARWTWTLKLGYRIIILGTKAEYNQYSHTCYCLDLGSVCTVSHRDKTLPKIQNTSQNPKTRPRIQNTSQNLKVLWEKKGFLDVFLVFGDVFWIIRRVFGFSDRSVWDSGSVFGFWDVFWTQGSVFGFWKVFWILGCVLDPGTCFRFWEVFFDSGTCLVPTSHRMFVIVWRKYFSRHDLSEVLPSSWWQDISMEFLRSFLIDHFAGKPCGGVGCILSLAAPTDSS